MVEQQQATKRLKRDEDASPDDICSGLPIECFNDSSGGFGVQATLREGSWWAENRVALVEKALWEADPEGEVSLGADYDVNKARNMLMNRGWVDVEHFLTEEQRLKADIPYRLEEASPMGSGEVGWNVRITDLQNVSLEKALKIVDSTVARLARDFDCNDLDDPDTSASVISGLPADASTLRQRVRLLLNKHSRPSSIRYAKVKQEHRHAKYASEGFADSLMWLTTDNLRVELASSFNSRLV